MRAKPKNDISHAHEALKASIFIESEVTTRIRCTSKALESKYQYGIQSENANSLYQLQCENNNVWCQNAEFTIGSQRKLESGVSERRIHYRFAAKTRVCGAGT